MKIRAIFSPRALLARGVDHPIPQERKTRVCITKFDSKLRVCMYVYIPANGLARLRFSGVLRPREQRFLRMSTRMRGNSTG